MYCPLDSDAFGVFVSRRFLVVLLVRFSRFVFVLFLVCFLFVLFACFWLGPAAIRSSTVYYQLDPLL